jgi:hypothetical protein
MIEAAATNTNRNEATLMTFFLPVIWCWFCRGGVLVEDRAVSELGAVRKRPRPSRGHNIGQQQLL